MTLFSPDASWNKNYYYFCIMHSASGLDFFSKCLHPSFLQSIKFHFVFRVNDQTSILIFQWLELFTYLSLDFLHIGFGFIWRDSRIDFIILFDHCNQICQPLMHALMQTLEFTPFLTGIHFLPDTQNSSSLSNFHSKLKAHLCSSKLLPSSFPYPRMLTRIWFLLFLYLILYALSYDTWR